MRMKKKEEIWEFFITKFVQMILHPFSYDTKNVWFDFYIVCLVEKRNKSWNRLIWTAKLVVKASIIGYVRIVWVLILSHGKHDVWNSLWIHFSSCESLWFQWIIGQKYTIEEIMSNQLKLRSFYIVKNFFDFDQCFRYIWSTEKSDTGLQLLISQNKACETFSITLPNILHKKNIWISYDD